MIYCHFLNFFVYFATWYFLLYFVSFQCDIVSIDTIVGTSAFQRSFSPRRGKMQKKKVWIVLELRHITFPTNFHVITFRLRRRSFVFACNISHCFSNDIWHFRLFILHDNQNMAEYWFCASMCWSPKYGLLYYLLNLKVCDILKIYIYACYFDSKYLSNVILSLTHSCTKCYLAILVLQLKRSSRVP